MLFNVALGKLIAIGRTMYSAFNLKSPSCEAAANAPYKHAHVPADFTLYSNKQQGRSGMRFAILLDSGLLRVFTCPVLVEDARENPPLPTVVARLGDSVQGGTYIALDPALFTKTALVLVSQRNGAKLGTTKQVTTVLDLVDEDNTKVKLDALEWTGSYPDSPNINLVPIVYGIPPSYAAHDNHNVTEEFPVDTPEMQTWPSYTTIQEFLAYTHQHANGASMHNHLRHPVFAEKNWTSDGPGKDCMANGNENLAEMIYSEFEILDPTSALAKAAEVEMKDLYQLPIMREAETLASPDNGASNTAGVPSPGGSDSTAFIQALTGGIKDVLNNTSGGENDPRKRNLWTNIVKPGGSWEQQNPPARLVGRQLHQHP